MSLLQFISENPWISFGLAIVIGLTLYSIAWACVAALGIFFDPTRNCDDGE